MTTRPVSTSISTSPATTSEAQLSDADFEAMLEQAHREAIEEAAKERSTTAPAAAAAAAAAGSSTRTSSSATPSMQDGTTMSPDEEEELTRQQIQMMRQHVEQTFWMLLSTYEDNRTEFDVILSGVQNMLGDFQSGAVDNEDLVIRPYGQSGKFVKIKKKDLSFDERKYFEALSLRAEELMQEGSFSTELGNLMSQLEALIQRFLREGKAKIIEQSDLPAPTLSAKSVSERTQFLSLLGIDNGLHQSMATHKEFDSKVITALFDVLSKHTDKAHAFLSILLKEKMTESNENAYCAFHKELQSSFSVEKFAKLRDHFVACLIKLLQP